MKTTSHRPTRPKIRLYWVGVAIFYCYLIYFPVIYPKYIPVIYPFFLGTIMTSEDHGLLDGSIKSETPLPDALLREGDKDVVYLAGHQV